MLFETEDVLILLLLAKLKMSETPYLTLIVDSELFSSYLHLIADDIFKIPLLFVDRPLVYLTDTDLVKQVLVTNCYKYLRPSLVRLLMPPLGNSLLTSNGKDHAWQRKMINPAFSYTNLKGMVPFMKTAADDLVQVCKY